MTKPNCTDCKWFITNSPEETLAMGFPMGCRRFPQWIRVVPINGRDHWCGEFKEKK